ncbi:hypothetical protein [Clostridium manihotivorum]|uniref:Uncharacterized protein n=1 Tax=Clostridium manihotivorum TaxID=2320868 RepID=A0A3R5X228_9CLOT|nr:hypothetical protein [Clostridium manihotivorum]QAA32550.1 hypothetical protein C1I91_13410 [Clostridium manihotivorum]
MVKLKKISIFILSFICFLIAINEISFFIDKSEIQKGNNPVFILKKDIYKDGGTTVYYGLGYQIISWNQYSKQSINGIEKDGTLKGIETHRFPFYNNVIHGGKPSIQLEFAEGTF